MNKISLSAFYEQLRRVLKPESSFYLSSIAFGIGVSVLSLAIPISVQSLVNTVAFGVLNQPLIILTIVLLSFLFFSGVLKGFQVFVIELFQRRFYARMSSEIAVRILNSRKLELENTYGVNLVHRYFDVMTIQKKMTTVLIDGIAVVLQTIVGLLLLAFYHPYFLAFDLILIGSVYFVLAFFLKDALYTSIQESKSKYKVANWLSEIARTGITLRTTNRKKIVLDETDALIDEHIEKRKKHFNLVFIQTISFLTIYAFMSALVLGLGGMLVMEGQLTLGQLVAAELIVTVILANLSKFNKYLEAFYDLSAAVDKLDVFFQLKSEKIIEMEDSENILQFIDSSRGIEFKEASVISDIHEYKFDYHFQPGKSYLIYSSFNSCKATFINILKRITDLDKGSTYLNGILTNEISSQSYRDRVYVVERPNAIEGSAFLNFKLYNDQITASQIDEVLSVVELEHLKEYFNEENDKILMSSGYPLWPGQLIRFEIAKAIVSNCDFIVFGELFDQIEKERRARILNYLKNKKKTVILLSHRNDHLFDFDETLEMSRDGINKIKNGNSKNNTEKKGKS